MFQGSGRALLLSGRCITQVVLELLHFVFPSLAAAHLIFHRPFCVDLSTLRRLKQTAMSLPRRFVQKVVGRMKRNIQDVEKAGGHIPKND